MPDTARFETGQVLAAARNELLRGRPAASCARIDELILADPGNVAALHLKGLCEAHAAAWSAAAASFRRALAASPDDTNSLRDLGSVLAAQGDWAAATDAFSQAVARCPGDRAALAGYGRVLLEQNRSAEAIRYLTEASCIRQSGSVLLSLGRSFAAEDRFGEASEALERAIALEPERVDAHRMLGKVAFARKDFELARNCWENVMRLSPGDEEAEHEILRVFWKSGEFRLTIDAIDAKILNGTASEASHAFWLYAQMYELHTGAERRRNCGDFGKRVAPCQVRRFHSDRGSASAHSKLRIGYLTGEFISGPPFYFLSPLLGNHDFQNFEVFLYHTREVFDTRSDWYSRLANWRNCRGLDDDALRRVIEQDSIQILVDLSGFYPENRLRIFAGRAAPVQATYPNCPTTTGIAEIDYIFTDRWTCKRGQEEQYTERAIHLPSGYLVYSPPDYSPAVTTLPALGNGFVTFGVFQRRAKIRDAFWDAAADILRQCDRSRLLVQDFDSDLDDPESRNYQMLLAELTSRGIPASRVSLRGARPHHGTLQTMAEADIALDTFPYQGQTTTCECLWQGVPVVALSGETHVSRVGSALLMRAGLRQLVATTRRGYVRKAENLASDLASLARMRAGMRDRLAQSTLLDGVRLARDVERMYRRMWRAWRKGEFLGSNQMPDRLSQNAESGQRRTRE